MENFSNAAVNMTTSCFSPYAELLQGICDFTMSFFEVTCESKTAMQEVFECSNPQIKQYLRKHDISDPEAYIRYGIEKAYRMQLSEGKLNNSNNSYYYYANSTDMPTS